MGATFVMSYPSSDWHIAAGANRRSATARASATPVNPRAALLEWIALADAILYAGGRILVRDAVPGNPGSVYTADWGALIRRGDQPLFLAAKSGAAHRAGDAAIARKVFTEAGVAISELSVAWGGRGDLQLIGPGRYLYVAGARTKEGAGAELAREIGGTVRFVEAKVKAPFEFGDEVAAVVRSKTGDGTLLAHQAGLADRTLADLRSAFSPVDVVSVDASDAEAGACSALCVNGTAIIPAGISTSLRGTLARTGLQLVELELPQLFGLGGGGPRALVNELVGFVIGDGAPDYARARERIVALVDNYPERRNEPEARSTTGSAPT